MHPLAPSDPLERARPGALGHQAAQAKVPPGGLPPQLRGLLYAEGGVLVRHDVVLVLGVDGLMVRRDVDVVRGQAVLAEGFEEVGVAGAVEVEGGEVGVFVLEGCLDQWSGRNGVYEILSGSGMAWAGGWDWD